MESKVGDQDDIAEVSQHISAFRYRHSAKKTIETAYIVQNPIINALRADKFDASKITASSAYEPPPRSIN